jgi:NodT family efflux transporter outer membrane factor (OMF) lipoprotein
MRAVSRSALVLALALAGCTVGPDYKRPDLAMTPAWQAPADPGAVSGRWWEALGDPLLNALVTEAIASSPDVRAATARLAEARADRDEAAGRRLPALDAKGSAVRNRTSQNGQIPINRIPGFARDYNLFDLGFDASWEIDLWGGRTRAVQAAEARGQAAVEDRRDALTSLIAELARDYVDLRRAQADVTSARESLAASEALARLTAQRTAAGEASAADADRAESDARTATATLANAQAEVTAAMLRVAALVGKPPEDVTPRLVVPAPIPASPPAIAAGLRSDLLTRRPDIRRAERELAAATADVGVATADLFPRLSLIGGIGQQARKGSDLDSGTSTRWQFGPSFSWPIFSGGQARARLRAADARADGAAARYDKTVAGALADSETAINRFARAREAQGAAEEALARDRAIFALAEQRARAGEDDQLALARARLTLMAAQQRRDAAAAAASDAAIALSKALGGGWREGEAYLAAGEGTSTQPKPAR